MPARRSQNPPPPTLPATERGVVENLFPADDYGLLRTEDGRELPFYRDGVDGEFDRLNIGAAVLYREAATEEGPAAVGVVLAP